MKKGTILSFAALLALLLLSGCQEGAEAPDSSASPVVSVPVSSAPMETADASAPPASVPPEGRQVIRFGVQSSEYSETIAAFNAENDTYYIEPVPLYTPGEMISVGEGIARLNLAIANGELDLAVSRDYTPMWNYAKKGLLVPLEEAAPDLFAEGVLMPNVVEAMKVDGHCCFLAPSFNLHCFSLPEEDAREFSNMDEFLDFAAHAYPMKYNEPFVSLFYILKAYGDYWVDPEEGPEAIDWDSFARLLEFCSAFEPDYDLMLTDAPQVEFGVSYGGNGNVPVPIPGRKSSGVSLDCYTYFGIIRGGNEAGAAEFLRYMLLEGDLGPVEGNNCIPTSQARFETWLKASETRPDGAVLFRFDEEQKATIRTLVPKADHVNHLGYDLYRNVMCEEARAYFEGDCTLDQAVERIRSRVTLYLSELG